MKYKSLSEVIPTVRQDYSKSIIFDINDLPAGGHMLQTVTIPPKTKQRSHYHNIQTEVFFILEGECYIYINDKEYFAKSGDAFACEPTDKHYLWNKSENDFKLVVFKINRPEGDEDTVWVEEIK